MRYLTCFLLVLLVVGKTTVAKALCNQLGADYYVINGSDEGRFLDTVRNTAKELCFDRITFKQLQNTKSSSLMRQITQPMMYNSSYGRLLRSLVTTADSSLPVTSKTKFSNHFIPACAVVEFSIKGKDRQGLAASGFFKRIQEILDTEGVKYDNKVLVELINKHFPDWRRVLE